MQPVKPDPHTSSYPTFATSCPKTQIRPPLYALSFTLAGCKGRCENFFKYVKCEMTLFAAPVSISISNSTLSIANVALYRSSSSALTVKMANSSSGFSSAVTYFVSLLGTLFS
ncbi:hypothetical protein ILYODFUR_038823 [Ilyodon furcidens]|uniref:Uncharacterized protein n=1 Tax=Ilyodon furcidens TaxID=33524 RepID=A0ABV0V9P4_9TELE